MQFFRRPLSLKYRNLKKSQSLKFLKKHLKNYVEQRPYNFMLQNFVFNILLNVNKV